ncbi:MAG TPA: sulfatase-like hydrolase/transferase [Fimbriimonas sp.]|nr:sulfatase-like hydrolase/transferase [Fimbriimonas sp.]
MADEVSPAKSADRAWPVHPLFVATFPVLSVYSANVSLVPLHDLWRPLGVALGGALAVWIVLLIPYRNLRRSAVATTVFCALFLLYSIVGVRIGLDGFPWVWCFIALAAGVIASLFIRSTWFLNLAATLLVVMASGDIAIKEIRIAGEEARIAREDQVATKANAVQPDIIYMILDGYGRADMLKRVMGFDNSPFTDGLQKRGFYVVPKSHSNYVQTEISLASSLNMRLIPSLLPSLPRDTEDHSPFDKLITTNSLAAFLRKQGYRTISITSGFPPIEFPNSDLWLRSATQLTLFEGSLLQMTPISEETDSGGSQFVWRRGAILDTFKNLQDLSFPTPRPRFFFIHVLAPHPPFVFGPNGEVQPHHGPFGYWDGSDYMEYAGTPQTYRNGYVGQVQYLNKQVLATVDSLLKNAKTPPVIVIQGDHGSKLRLDQSSLAKTDVTECFQNLEALYVPQAVRAKLYPTLTPVNEFRIILDTLFGTKMPLLPDKSWYSPFPHPMEFTEVTDRIEVSQATAKPSAR